MEKTDGQNDAKRTIFILYIPGGAILGIIPAVILAHLEELTETPAFELFQVLEGVSTGSILVGGMSGPGKTAAKGAEAFCEEGPRFFPHMPGRVTKMITANVLNLLIDTLRLDPQEVDRGKIKKLKNLCEEIKNDVPIILHRQVEELEEIGCKRWFTHKMHKRALEICSELSKRSGKLRDLTADIAEILAIRTHTSRLSVPFKQAALSGLRFMRPKNYLFDPEVPKKFFQGLMGERHLSDSRRSTYISAYDIRRNKIVTFSSRKKDYFDLDSETAESHNDVKIWDAVMASIANTMAFPPHIMEDGTVCSDKAILHTPLRALEDALEHKPADADVKLVIVGTGKRIEEDLEAEVLRDYYVDYGIAGNLLKGKELTELQNYAMTYTLQVARKKIGAENIIELNPRLSPYTPEEEETFPSNNILDASVDNIRKILKRARDYLVDHDPQIRQVARMLVDNLHNIGQISDEKYARICRKIENHDAQAILRRKEGIGQQISKIYNDVSKHRPWWDVAGHFNDMCKRIFGKTPPVPPPPSGGLPDGPKHHLP